MERERHAQPLKAADLMTELTGTVQAREKGTLTGAGAVVRWMMTRESARKRSSQRTATTGLGSATQVKGPKTMQQKHAGLQQTTATQEQEKADNIPGGESASQANPQKALGESASQATPQQDPEEEESRGRQKNAADPQKNRMRQKGLENAKRPRRRREEETTK